GVVTLVNATGHRVPTAEPHRWVEVTLEGLDDGGKVLGTSTVRIERDVDLDALVEHSDSTLRPREERPLVLRVKSASRARLSVRFHTWSDDRHPVHELFSREYRVITGP